MSLLRSLSNNLQNGWTKNSSSEFLSLLQTYIDLLTLDGNGGSISEEESVTEIEEFHSFLSNALKFVNKKLKPSHRTLEEDQKSVSNPTKWIDLGQNLLQGLQEILDRPKKNPGEVETAKNGATFTRNEYRLIY